LKSWPAREGGQKKMVNHTKKNPPLMTVGNRDRGKKKKTTKKKKKRSITKQERYARGECGLQMVKEATSCWKQGSNGAGGHSLWKRRRGFSWRTHLKGGKFKAA